jgi:hypothetical protein
MGIENIKAGICHLSFGGVDLGLTKGGVEVKLGVTVTDEPKVGEPDTYSPRLMLVSAEASCPFAEMTLQTLMASLPWCQVAANNTITIRDVAGEPLRQYAKTMILTTEGGEIITFPAAIPIITSSWRYVSNSERITIVSIKSLPDLNGVLATIKFPDNVGDAEGSSTVIGVGTTV